MRILLLGGSGAMGVHLARFLSDKGHFVDVTSRQYKDSKDSNICYLQGDAHDLDFIKNVLFSKQYDAIVDFMIYNTIEFLDRIDFLLNNCTHYVFLSTARVYADSKNPLMEDSPRLLDVSQDRQYLATDEYALTKARQENILNIRTQNNYTIIRPYITFSEIRLQLGVYEKESWLYRAMQKKSIIFFKDIAKHYTTLTYAKEVVRAMALIIGNKKTFRQTYHITSDKSMRWENILDIYKKVLLKELGFAKIAFANLNDFFEKNNYQVIYDRLFDRKFDNSKINALLVENHQKPLGGGGFRALSFFVP